jgi:hypothetical protein
VASEAGFPWGPSASADHGREWIEIELDHPVNPWEHEGAGSITWGANLDRFAPLGEEAVGIIREAWDQRREDPCDRAKREPEESEPVDRVPNTDASIKPGWASRVEFEQYWIHLTLHQPINERWREGQGENWSRGELVNDGIVKRGVTVEATTHLRSESAADRRDTPRRSSVQRAKAPGARGLVWLVNFGGTVAVRAARPALGYAFVDRGEAQAAARGRRPERRRAARRRPRPDRPLRVRHVLRDRRATAPVRLHGRGRTRRPARAGHGRRAGVPLAGRSVRRRGPGEPHELAHPPTLARAGGTLAIAINGVAGFGRALSCRVPLQL